CDVHTQGPQLAAPPSISAIRVCRYFNAVCATLRVRGTTRRADAMAAVLRLVFIPLSSVFPVLEQPYRCLRGQAPRATGVAKSYSLVSGGHPELAGSASLFGAPGHTRCRWLPGLLWR